MLLRLDLQPEATGIEGNMAISVTYDGCSVLGLEQEASIWRCEVCEDAERVRRGAATATIDPSFHARVQATG